MEETADIIVIGAGLAGLVAATEAVAAGKKVMLIDQEGEQNMGGQAYWSFGGLFFVNSPEQRRMGIRDSYELALQDWMGSAGFDRPEDYWPRKWAEAYVAFAAGEKRTWLRQWGLRFFPVVGWAERGGALATGHGNSVPRFHITWGTGTGVVAPFVIRLKEAAKEGKIIFKFRHKVKELTLTNGQVTGISGDVLEPGEEPRGVKSSRKAIAAFAFKAGAVIVASGGIGGNHEMVRRNWPARLGNPPDKMLSGVPDYVDGSMIAVVEQAGGHIINADRMWHYTEGIHNWAPIWPNHGIRILPGPSSFWIDARGNRLPPPLFPGFDTLGTLRHIMQSGDGYSWFILNQRIIRKEFALSGSEQNPDLTAKSWRQVLGRAIGKHATPPVEAFKKNGIDFIVKNGLEELVAGMNALTGDTRIELALLKEQIRARDMEITNPFCKDAQITAIRGARKYLGDKLIRTAPPHRLLDPHAGPLIAVKLNILTRKTLGGLQTDLSGRVLHKIDEQPVKGLYAAGEIAGFGGGGMHGYNALEGSFLGGCLFSGRIAGQSAARDM